MALPAAALMTLSWRNLWRNYRRTLIMLLAITVGVWAMIFMTALLRGMVDNMVRTGISVLPGHVQIHAEERLCLHEYSAVELNQVLREKEQQPNREVFESVEKFQSYEIIYQ